MPLFTPVAGVSARSRSQGTEPESGHGAGVSAWSRRQESGPGAGVDRKRTGFKTLSHIIVNLFIFYFLQYYFYPVSLSASFPVFIVCIFSYRLFSFVSFHTWRLGEHKFPCTLHSGMY